MTRFFTLTVLLALTAYPFQTFSKTKQLGIDIKIQIIDLKTGQPKTNQIVIFKLSHNRTDTVYTDSAGYLKYTYKHAYPYCCCSFKSLIGNSIYKHKKIKIIFSVEQTDCFVKIKHKRYDYDSFDGASKKTYEKIIKV